MTTTTYCGLCHNGAFCPDHPDVHHARRDGSAVLLVLAVLAAIVLGVGVGWVLLAVNG